MYISPINYQQNIMMNKTNFRSKSIAKPLEERIFNNPEAKKIVEDAMKDMNFSDATFQNSKQKLEEVLGTKIDSLEMIDIFLAACR